MEYQKMVVQKGKNKHSMLHGWAVARNYIETSYLKHWIQPKLLSIWESGRMGSTMLCGDDCEREVIIHMESWIDND